MHRFKFTLSLRTIRDEPGVQISVFELDARTSEAFARELGLPWPPEHGAFRKGRLEIAIRRREHAEYASRP